MTGIFCDRFLAKSGHYDMQTRGARTVSYRWVIVFAGVCGLFASLGIGRFALGMLLPAMGEALDLSYAEMGIVGTINFCGYLLAVLLCGKLSIRFSPRLLITTGLMLVGLSMVVIGFVEHLYFISFLYFLTGVGSALSNVPIMALITAWFPSVLRGRAAGMVVVGNGLGIIVSGNVVPRLHDGGYGWQVSWISLGALACCSALICWVLIRNNPTEPVMTTKRGPSPSVKEGEMVVQPESARQRLKPMILHCSAIYFLFGFTYVIYTTFFVTSLVQERGFTEQHAGYLWSWVGVLSLISGPLFGSLSDRFGRKIGLILVFTIQAAAYSMAIPGLPPQFLYISIFCFGIAAWSIPSIMAALVGDVAGPLRAAEIFGFVTFIFGIGQITGPLCAGALAEITGGFAMSFAMAAVLGISAALISSLLPAITRNND